MIKDILINILLPFFGTAAGALPVVFTKNLFSHRIANALNCFAAGVMVAASVWSLLIPAIDCSSSYSKLNFLPATVGFWIGVFTLAFTDRFLIKLSTKTAMAQTEKHKSTFILVAAVALHNLPEGMAVGVACAGLLSGEGDVTAASAFALSLGVAIQNIPEGAIVSLPLRSTGMSKLKSFGFGVFSGIVEPVGAVLTVLLSFLFVPLLPYLLGFAAGTMISVVVGELIPESNNGNNSVGNTAFFAVGFSVMMILDVALG